MEQLQHAFALLKKEWAAYIARLKKGSLVDIASLVTAALLAAMLLAILTLAGTLTLPSMSAEPDKEKGTAHEAVL